MIDLFFPNSFLTLESIDCEDVSTYDKIFSKNTELDHKFFYSGCIHIKFHLFEWKDCLRQTALH